MRHLEWIAHDRLDKFSRQITRIEEAEFSNDSTRAALDAIRNEIDTLDRELTRTSSLPQKFLNQHIVTINQKIFSYSTALGVLLRSTNLRNSFEAYFAFHQMAENITGSKNRLIISSEWDSVPFFIPSPPAALSGFVIIGIPAFASRNSLLLPLAAHELGHASWRLDHVDAFINELAEKEFDSSLEQNPERFQAEFNLTPDLFIQNEVEYLRVRTHNQ